MSAHNAEGEVRLGFLGSRRVLCIDVGREAARDL
jgi:hypothetical protein